MAAEETRYRQQNICGTKEIAVLGMIDFGGRRCIVEFIAEVDTMPPRVSVASRSRKGRQGGSRATGRYRRRRQIEMG